MDPTKKESPAESAAAPRRLSRRSVMQAGLKAGPVLMSLPTVPAFANVNQSTCSNGPNPGTCSNADQAVGGTSQDESLFGPPGQQNNNTSNKDKDKKDKDGTFLSSGNWLNSKP